MRIKHLRINRKKSSPLKWARLMKNDNDLVEKIIFDDLIYI